MTHEDIGRQLHTQLAYACRMRDEYAGRPGIFERLHADWLAYIERQWKRIEQHAVA